MARALQGLKELGELVASYQGLRESGRGPSIVNSIVATARQCNLDKDVELPGEEDDTADLSLDERDGVVGKVKNLDEFLQLKGYAIDEL